MTIAIAGLGISASANELNNQVRLDLTAALGKVFSTQVSALTQEINKDITTTINDGLVEMGFEVSPGSTPKAEKVMTEQVADK